MSNVRSFMSIKKVVNSSGRSLPVKPRASVEPILLQLPHDNRPYLSVMIGRRTFSALLDSGSNTTILGSSGLHVLKELNLAINYDISLQLTTADGQIQNTLGYVQLPIVFNGDLHYVKTLIVPTITHELVLGMDFILKFNLKIDFGNFSYSSELSSCVVNCIQGPEKLSSEQRSQLNEVVRLFEEIGPDDVLGCTHLYTHHIDTGSAKPFKQRQYPLSHAMQKVLNEQVDEMLELDIIEPCVSPWSSPLWLVNKKDGSYRVCFDGRKLNAVTVPDSYPPPLIDSVIMKIRDAKFLSSIDLKSAFFQIPLDEESKCKTAFAVHGRGLFCFKRLPFGLSNSSSAMCRLLDSVIGPDLEPYVFYYLDDIIVATPDFTTHLKILREVYTRLKNANLTVNFQKCHFCRPSLKFLGFIVDEAGLRTDPEKISALLNYPTPRNTTQIRRLIGLIGYYRRFLKDFASISSPINDLLKGRKKGQSITWSNEADEAFQKIKILLTTAPVLASPNFVKPFSIMCDASDSGVAGILFQEDDGLEHPIAFFSKTLNKAQRKYTTTEKELLAVLLSIEKFRCYVEGVKFTVISDHSSLQWLQNMKNPSPRLARWLLRLSQYDFTIIHRKGTDIPNVDALSRSGVDSTQISILNTSTLNPDKWYKDMVSNVRNNPDLFPAFRVENAILYKHVFQSEKFTDTSPEWKIVVPTPNRVEILKLFHDDPTAGHLGVLKTFSRVSKLYYWPRMKQSIQLYVRSCRVCAQCKPDNLPQAGLMGKYRDIKYPFQMISADLLGPYPRSKNGNRFVLVVCDWFTKFVLVHPMSKATTSSIIKFLENQVFLIFGVPQIVVVDNGPQFISKDFKQLMQSYNVQKIWYNARYHPQVNPCERVNRTLTTAIRSYIKENQKTWDTVIFKVAQAIRLAKHEVTGYSPSFLNFYRNVPVDGSFYGNIIENAKNDVNLSNQLIDPDILQNLPEIFSKVQERIRHSYQTNKNRYDLRKRNVQFKVGDKVMKRNYVLSKACDSFAAKLAPKFIPGIVHKVKSPLVYTLKDSLGNILGDFHVKDLKPDVSRNLDTDD